MNVIHFKSAEQLRSDLERVLDLKLSGHRQCNSAMIGLGRMGGNMTERLMRGGHDVVVFDRKPDTSAALRGARRYRGDRA